MLTNKDELIINGKPVGCFNEDETILDFEYISNNDKFNRYMFEMVCRKNSKDDEIIKNFLNNKNKYKIEISLIKKEV